MPVTSDQINIPAVKDELSAIAERYEAALVGNDRLALDRFFLPGADTLRFGLADEQYGYDAVVAFRASLPLQSPPRRILRCDVSTYGNDWGTVNLEFRYTDRQGGGRQSQTWVRSDLPGHGGWRIVAAHVSLKSEAQA